VDELLADPEVDLVLNLTVPQAHGEVAEAALDAGKSVYNEKPLTLTREDARTLLEKADGNGLRVGCAPDTFLGAGLQTCRKLIDEGAIGTPVSATAFMLSRGVERWHPNPGFYYQPGGGPMFDMGPYYLTALVFLMGPVRRVAGTTARGFAERVIGSEPHRGERIRVEVPTTVLGLMDFAQGGVGAIVTSFDVMGRHSLPRIEIHGTEGSLSVPDPNTFRGPVRLARPEGEDWEEIPLAFGYEENSRGLGVADMAAGIRSGRPHRASGDLAAHVLDVMHGFHDAARDGRFVEPTMSCVQPAPFPQGLEPWTVDP
jgi:predicted dehydrogenase